MEREVGNNPDQDNPDQDMRSEALNLSAICTERAHLDQQVPMRAEVLEQTGYGAFDALHLACAESTAVDFLLTTDDRFMRQMMRGLGNPTTTAMNPVNGAKEFTP